jgi:hypothetical protein
MKNNRKKIWKKTCPTKRTSADDIMDDLYKTSRNKPYHLKNFPVQKERTRTDLFFSNSAW